MCGDDVELTYSLDTLTHVARLFVEEQVAQGMDESGAASRQVHSFLRFIDRHGQDGFPSTVASSPIIAAGVLEDLLNQTLEEMRRGVMSYCL